MQRKIIITGATGLIGRKISEILIENNNYVIIFSRRPEIAKEIIKNASEYVLWDYEKSSEWKNFLEGSDAIINLAGESIISNRWNKKTKQRIYNSRIITTRSLVNAVKEISNKPESFISASAVGYYGNRNEEVNEYSEKGNGFLANLVNDWESESKVLEKYNVRVVNIRLGTVLSMNGGALPKLVNQFKLFLGGTLGNGNQWFPWIHIDDAAGIFLFALNNRINGILNAVSPNLITQKEFSKILAKVLKKPCFFRIPVILLKIILGEAANVLLEGAKVYPKLTIEYGYQFKYDDIEKALINLLKSNNFIT
ncbi:MAG: TIGR01777 family oxidoreductase [Melioribacter sp.]|uniref:TIGR01777 family oxidoreductase n=1 Tax=Rosettibacter primus TaxID=3111523 RepID=UPI00247F10AE|nr:TIGR01777 family oxidoreductase [Melioribacter sp.]